MQRNITFDLIEHVRVRPAAPALLLARRTVSYQELALGRLGATSYSIPRSASSSQRRQMAAHARVDWLASDQPERYDAGIPALRLACPRPSTGA